MAKPPTEKQKNQNAFETLCTLLLYSTSSSLMMLVNKTIVGFCRDAVLLVLIQNVVTVICLKGLFIVKPEHGVRLDIGLMKQWFLVATTFVIMIVTSLMALERVSAATVLVFRNVTVFAIAVADMALFKKSTSAVGWVTLLVMCIGSYLYARDDIMFDSQGYKYVALNIFATAANHIYAKWLMDSKHISLQAFAMAYYNNVMSIPLLAVALAFSHHSSEYYMGLTLAPSSFWISLALSCLFGFFLSVTSYALQKTISATSFAVASNCNKFITIYLSSILFQDIYNEQAFGLAIALIGGVMFSFVKMKGEAIESLRQRRPVVFGGTVTMAVVVLMVIAIVPHETISSLLNVAAKPLSSEEL